MVLLRSISYFSREMVINQKRNLKKFLKVKSQKLKKSSDKKICSLIHNI